MFSPFPFLFVLIPTVHPQIHLFIPSQQNPVNKKGHFTGTHSSEDMKKHPLPPTLLFRLIQFQLLWWSRPLLIVVSFTPEWKIMQIFGRRSVPSCFRLRQDSRNPHCFSPTIKSIIWRDKFHLHAAQQCDTEGTTKKKTKKSWGEKENAGKMSFQRRLSQIIRFFCCLLALFYVFEAEQNLLRIRGVYPFFFAFTALCWRKLGSFFVRVISTWWC